MDQNSKFPGVFGPTPVKINSPGIKTGDFLKLSTAGDVSSLNGTPSGLIV